MLKPALAIAAAGVVGLVLWTVLGKVIGPVIGLFLGIVFLLVKIAFVVGLIWLVMYLIRRRPDSGGEKGEAHAD